MNDITYEVDLNNDDLDLDKYNDFNQCLNNPVATITINMQNVYGKNMTELFRAFDGANNFNDDYERRGNIFYFDFYSQNFEKNIDYVYILDRSKTECVQTTKIIGTQKTSNVEFDYVISKKDWVDENTTITELNDNIAKNIVYCLSNSNIQDANWHVLRQNYYYIAHKNVVYIYACDNTCEDLSVHHFINPGGIGIINKSFVVDITNSDENNMNVKYNTTLFETEVIPLHFPPPFGPLNSYTIEQYQQILEGVITIMTQQFKELFPEQLKRLDRIAYTNIYNGKLYVSIDYNISNAVWLEGNGVEITPLYTNTNLSLPDEEIIAFWRIFELNVLTIKNY